MQEKLDEILEKLEEIRLRMGELEERIDDMESSASEQDDTILFEVQGIAQFIEEIYEYQKLDFKNLDGENLIFIHTNAFRTISFINALRSSCRNLHMLNKMTEKKLTPEYLAEFVALDENDSHLISSIVFSYSPKFETIIAEAIEGQKSHFIILTNAIEEIPQSIREKMRVIQ